jgi:hypothetical protein
MTECGMRTNVGIDQPEQVAHLQGVCHRCGWSGSVSKIDRRTRKQLQTDQRYGRLCGECRADLQRSALTHPSPSSQPARLRAVGERDVA